MDSQTIQYSPSEFVDVFNQSIDYAFPLVVVEGELSSFRVAKNRWVYFDIKDESATIRCFGTVYMLPGPLEDGMMVRIVCNPRLHPQFNFSLNIQSITPVGEGALAKQAELTYKKLEAEGIFAADRKRGVPYPPNRVALVTSVESAAYADFVKVSKARWPRMQIDAYDVLVQGASAPEQIVERIAQINQGGEEYDALIIVRGGGSVEDLAAFSDERVVRSIAASRVPTCVAIGHEVDESLAELACDLRASTPSNLAELLLPDKHTEQEWLYASQARLGMALGTAVSRSRDVIVAAHERMTRTLLQLIQLEQERLVAVTEKIDLLNPRMVLRRGYTIIKSSSGKIVSKGSDVHSGDEVDIIFTDTIRRAEIL